MVDKMLSQRPLVIGIDVGGTSIRGAIVAQHNRLASAIVRTATPAPAKIEAVVESVAGVVAELEAVGGPDVALLPVGVGLTADVRDYEHTNGPSPDTSWNNAPVRSMLEARLRRAVRIVNDADAAGIAELRLGTAGTSRVVIFLTLGTWIGSALFVDGRLVPNVGLGQLPFHGSPAEQLLGGRARNRRRLGWKRWAAEVTDYLGVVDELLRPDLLILGGGLPAWAGDAMALVGAPCTLKLARLGNDAGVLGAALAFQAGDALMSIDWRLGR